MMKPRQPKGSLIHVNECNKDSLKSLHYDEACMEIFMEPPSTNPLTLWYQREECFECDFEEWAHLPLSGKSYFLKVNHTEWPVQLFFTPDNNRSNKFCHQKVQFGEHGLYKLNVSNLACSELEIVQPPHNSYAPLLHLLFVYIICLAVYKLGIYFYYSCWSWRSRSDSISTEIRNDLGSGSSTGDSSVLLKAESPLPQKKHRPRIKSLDTFRGISICLMIFVNYGGGKYWFFKHSPWNGLTFADLVFPWFTWIMGVGIAISLRSQLRTCITRYSLFLQVLRRSCILILLGVILNSQGRNNLSQLRFPGVLQRLGLAYFIVASIETCLMKKQTMFQNLGRYLAFQDILEPWAQWIVVLLLTSLYTSIVFFLPVPNCPSGYLGPGGLHEHKQFFNCTGGATGYIDRLLFGINHIYQTPTSAKVYKSVMPFDPEGLLGVLPTVFLVYLGVQAGRILLCFHSTDYRVNRWVLWAVVLGMISGFLCKFSKDDGFIPINKNLWSLSFVFVTAGSAFFIFSILFVLVDYLQVWSGTPFRQAGMNSILLYIGHSLLHETFPWSWKPFSETSHFEYLFMNAWATFLWMMIGCVLFEKNVFINI